MYKLNAMKICSWALLVLCILFRQGAALAQNDSVHFQRDSVVTPAGDPTILYFQQHEKALNSPKIILVLKNGKNTSLDKFMKSLGPSADDALSDLDHDGKKELLVYNNTGAPHCCDEIYIFRNTGTNKYQQAVKLLGGNTVITDKNEFVFDFTEIFGYFFTCYNCNYTDTSDAAPVEISSVDMSYAKGKMILATGDSDLRHTIYDNLAKLGERPYQPVPDIASFDDGLRKAFAKNLAVYYFSFGRSQTATQELFSKYYKFPDAKKVWAAFSRLLQTAKTDMGF